MPCLVISTKSRFGVSSFIAFLVSTAQSCNKIRAIDTMQQRTLQTIVANSVTLDSSYRISFLPMTLSGLPITLLNLGGFFPTDHSGYSGA